jgi:DNA-binding LytR/AlgR family response regulator
MAKDGLVFIDIVRTFVVLFNHYIGKSQYLLIIKIGKSMSTSIKSKRVAAKALSSGRHTITSSREDYSVVPFGITHVVAPAKVSSAAPKKIMLPTMEGISFEKIKNIAYLEANGNYTLLHFTDGRQVLVCRSLCEIESRLLKTTFVRIHRSHTIHLRHLRKYVRGKGGHVVLNNGVVLAVSAGQKDSFLNALQQFFA